jgi:CubicO group peptidase (beta-lactamase class C family)
MKSSVTAIFLTVWCGAANAQLAEHVDRIAHEVLSGPAAGMSVAVARDGRTILARGYGLANVEDSVAVTPGTVFHIDSISKNILAGAVLQLVEEGKLSLDDDVRKYVPEAPTQGHRVTVRQLLNHTSGIYSYTSLPNSDDNERLDLTHEQLLASIKGKPFDFEPGTRWRYDNSGFYLAGMVVERVTKQEYGAYIREHLFKPLGMTTASLCNARMIVPHLATGYAAEDGVLTRAPFISWSLAWAPGSVCATATDLLTWQAALDSGHVLRPETLALMRTPTTVADGTKIDYGFGTRLGALDGHRIVGHTGSGGGFRSALLSFPDDHLTIAVLMNMDNPSQSPLAVAAQIARKALGTSAKPVVELPVPPEELAEVTGTTVDSDDGKVETFAAGGKVHFRIPDAKIEGVMQRISPDVYLAPDGAEIHIVVRGGRTAWAMVYRSGFFADAKYAVPSP